MNKIIEEKIKKVEWHQCGISNCNTMHPNVNLEKALEESYKAGQEERNETASSFGGKVIDYYGGCLQDDVKPARDQIKMIREEFGFDAKVRDTIWVVLQRMTKAQRKQSGKELNNIIKSLKDHE